MSKENDNILINSDLKEIIPKFLQNRKSDINTINELIISSDFNQIKHIAHKMAGSSGSYGFKKMGELGKEIELAASEQDLSKIKDKLAALNQHFNNLDIKFID
ncbi:MAG: Hpt domain-containing protein [Bdellovibrionales bacterium]|jgi:HPt (histidine-containing phosphotransfer) domain-containing protein|nr:Hpt domain-containing protein [Bdellovibrionales bacterium]